MTFLHRVCNAHGAGGPTISGWWSAFVVPRASEAAMEHTISDVEDALNTTREAMYDAEEACGQAELLVVRCNLQIEDCKTELDRLLDIRFHLPQQRLPSESTRGQAPQPY